MLTIPHSLKEERILSIELILLRILLKVKMGPSVLAFTGYFTKTTIHRSSLRSLCYPAPNLTKGTAQHEQVLRHTHRIFYQKIKFALIIDRVHKAIITHSYSNNI